MADRRLPYYAEAESNTFLDAEDVRVDSDGKEVVRQRVVDAGVVAAINTLLTRLQAIDANTDTLEALLAGTLAADVTDRAARLLGHVIVDAAPNVSGSVAVTNHPSDFPDATGQTTLASILAKLTSDPATDAKLETLRVLLAGTLTVQQAAALPTGTNNIGYTSPGVAQKVGQGRVNLAGTGRITLNVAGNLRIVAQNPAESAKTISIVRIAGLTTGTGWASIVLNPTTGVPSTAARPILNAVAGGGIPSLLTLRADTSTTVPLGGGIDTGLVLGMPGNERVSLDLPPIILTPGVTLGINIPFTGAADAAMSIYWIED